MIELTRDRLVALGLALVMFAIGALVAVDVPYLAIGVLVIALAVVQLVRVQRADDWAIVDTGMAFWLLLVGGTTIWTPAWGVPLLFVTAGIQLVQALDNLGMVINLTLVALLAYSRNAPNWVVALLLIVAAGKLFWMVRSYLGYGSPGQSLPS
jgi:hypothetical protein